jgi:thioredoxin-dependent peroxiredoxin
MEQLKKGDTAPEFTFSIADDKKIELSQYKGKKVILYFYPKDDTPGCTAEACNLRDNYYELLKRGFQIIGVSADPAHSHKKFSDKYQLPFPLIADTEKTIIKSYHVWGEKTMYGKSYEGILRTTFIISEDGKIAHIIDKVDTKDHTRQILEILAEK